MLRLTLLAVTSLVLAVSARAGDVTLVDPGGGGGVALLEEAILSAQVGDTLLLAEGDYFGPPGTSYLIRKGITLLAAPGAHRPKLQHVLVRDLLAGETLVMRGIDFGGPVSLGADAPLWVFDCDGAVWLEDCTLRGYDATPKPGLVPAGGQDAARVGPQAAVFFRQCTLQGGRGADAVPEQGVPFSGAGANGLSVDGGSTVSLHECQLLGGDAGNGPATTVFGSGRGGDALVLGGDATIAGCTLVGGAEGAGNDAQPSSSGSALTCEIAMADGRVLSSTLTAGAVQGAGTAAPALLDVPGKVLLLAEPARSLSLPAQIREAESGTLALDGEPGDVAWLFLSADATLTPLLGQKGTLALDLGTLMGPLVLGFLPAPDGVLDIPFQVHDLPPGVESLPVYVQGVFLDGDGSALGGASVMTWIDSAF